VSEQLWKLGASELATRIRRKQVSSREVIEAHLRRIEAVNPRVNAVTVNLGESALAAADAADRALASGDEVGPLHGVPMTVKENLDLVGSATTHGVTALRDQHPRADSPHIAELRAAGAIPLGRTNTPDFASRWHTDNELRGATLNPWAADRTPGGSSGGDAAALASGMTPLGMGNDIAGSLRWPSQCCGTTALKASLGRIAWASQQEVRVPMSLAGQLLAVNGPMARHVRDLRLAFGHMCWPCPSDPWQVPAPLEGPPVAAPIRVSVLADPAGLGVDPDVADAVRRAADQLADAGYAVEERELPSLARAAEIYFQIMGRFSQMDPDATPIGELGSRDFARFMEALTPAFVAAGGEQAPDPFGERQSIARAWGELQAEVPLVLAPVASVPAFEVGSDLDPAGSEAWMRAVRMIVVVNLLGLPSVAFPTHEANGLPHGVQIIGPRFREDLCLDAAEAVEQRLGTLTPIDPR
jgi:amidase